MEAPWLLFLVGAGLGFLVDYLIRILDDDEYASERTIKILDKDRGGIKLEPKKVKLYYPGRLTFDNQSSKSVTIEFRKKTLWRKKFKRFKGPFPRHGQGERGVYPVGKGVKVTLDAEIEPDIFTDYWKFDGHDEDGNKVDPGVRLKKGG